MTRLTVYVLLAVLLAGCRMDGLVAVTVDGDGGGTLAVTLAVDEELRQAAADAGADPLDALAAAGDRLAGWRAERSGSGADGDDRAVTLSTRFRDPVELEHLTRSFGDGLAGPELAPLGPMLLTVTQDTVELAGTADLRVSAAVRELGLSRRRARARLTESLRFRVMARMPGTVLRTNADERPDDHTVVWNIAPGEQRALRVTAERPWTLARIADALVDPHGVAATFIAVALILAWRLVARDERAPPLPPGRSGGGAAATRPPARL